MSKYNDTKANLAATHKPAISVQTSKRKLLINFVKFIAWVIVIGLLLSPFACQRQVILDDPLSFKLTDKEEGVSND